MGMNKSADKIIECSNYRNGEKYGFIAMFRFFLFKIRKKYPFFLFVFLPVVSSQGYDYPKWDGYDPFLNNKINFYNRNIHKIHLKLPIPFPFYSGTAIYPSPKNLPKEERRTFLESCWDKKLSTSNRRDSFSVDLATFNCQNELQEWISNLPERRKFHREFCKNPEELAYLDYQAYRYELKDPYEICKGLREEDLIRKNIQDLQVVVSGDLRPFVFPREDFPGKKDWEEYVVRLGLLDVYSMNHPFVESPRILLPSWDEFTPKKDIDNSYSSLLKNTESEYADHIRQQVTKNSSIYNQESNQKIRELIRQILELKELSSSQKQKIRTIQACIRELNKKNPNMSTGFYLGFFKRYAYSPDNHPGYPQDLHSAVSKEEYNLYKKKIQSLHWRQHQGSELFSRRLNFLELSCNTALQTNEKSITLKYLLELLGK